MLIGDTAVIWSELSMNTKENYLFYLQCISLTQTVTLKEAVFMKIKYSKEADILLIELKDDGLVKSPDLSP